MGIAPIRLYRYDVPLKHPVVMRTNTLTRRTGLLLAQEIEGQIRWGEAAPLPGFSRETIEQVIHAAQAQDWRRFPSLRFAFECLGHGHRSTAVPLNALVLGLPSTATGTRTPDGLADVGQWPHRAVKMKVGKHGELQQDIQRVRQLRRAMRPDQSLRLDANRGWTFDEAKRFAAAVAPLAVEYVEEPTPCPAEFEKLRQDFGLNYALDESLRDGPLGAALELQDSSAADWMAKCREICPHASAWILKPTLGGPDASWLSSVAPTHPQLVFSACFESGFALAHVARLAAEYAPGHAAGLDTHRWWPRDIRQPALEFDHGQLRVSGDLPNIAVQAFLDRWVQEL